jgi:dTDP-glucose 4,6-dehydratase
MRRLKRHPITSSRRGGTPFGLPVLISNCSNNYGPYQFPEKFIPMCIIKAICGEPVPVYGVGANVRDWIHVHDHARALRLIIEKGTPGETYNVGSGAERRNIDVAHSLCAILDDFRPRPEGLPHRELIRLVADRPGHDLRYAMDTEKIRTKLGWQPVYTFETGIEATVRWYIEQQDWWREILLRRYSGRRLGIAPRLPALPSQI